MSRFSRLERAASRLEHHHHPQLDVLIDATGFSEVPQPRRCIDIVSIAHDVVTGFSPFGAHEDAVARWFYDEAAAMQGLKYNDGLINSFILGGAVGFATLPRASRLSDADSFAIIARAVQNIRISSERFGFGDVQLFSGGFDNAHNFLRHDANLKRDIKLKCSDLPEKVDYEVRIARKMRPMKLPRSLR